MAAQRIPQAALRLRRSATAYKRLAWKRDQSQAQATTYWLKAERLDRQADQIIERAAARRAAEAARAAGGCTCGTAAASDPAMHAAHCPRRGA